MQIRWLQLINRFEDELFAAIFDNDHKSFSERCPDNEPQKRGQAPIAKWPEGCCALLVPAPFSEAQLLISLWTEH